jgi:hypothetical protein
MNRPAMAILTRGFTSLSFVGQYLRSASDGVSKEMTMDELEIYFK